MADCRVIHADSRDALRAMESASIDAVVTDPPYALVSIVKRFGGAGAAPAKDRDGLYKRASAGFMGKTWDTGDTAFDPAFWAEVLRVLKPGAHLVAFGGTRTYHRLVCAIEDAGFEIRDQLAWLFGSGFPKSHDVSKGIDRAAGVDREVIGRREEWAKRANTRPSDRAIMGKFADQDYDMGAITAPATYAARQWQGWGTALKPAHEPICLARKPLIGTVAANVLQHGTGALNIDACRVKASDGDEPATWSEPRGGICPPDAAARAELNASAKGRWPANVILSYPADEYALRSDVSAEQRRELFRWLHENA